MITLISLAELAVGIQIGEVVVINALRTTCREREPAGAISLVEAEVAERTVTPLQAEAAALVKNCPNAASTPARRSPAGSRCTATPDVPKHRDRDWLEADPTEVGVRV